MFITIRYKNHYREEILHAGPFKSSTTDFNSKRDLTERVQTW